MKTNPLISIVIPTYNHARFLSRALKSLQDQSFTNWEAIVVDNHSQDGTDELMKQVTDSRISFIKVHNNGVIAVSRNTAIAAAKGEWLAFLDSDDWWTNDKLSVCIKHIEKGADFIYHDLRIARDTPPFLDNNNIRTRQLTKPVLIDLLMHGNLISNSSVLVKKELMESAGRLDENPKMVGAEDFNGWLKIARQTERFVYVPNFLGFYEFHESGISRKDMSECFELATENFMEELTGAQQRKVSGHISYMKARFNLARKEFSNAKKWARKSFVDGDTVIKAKSIYVLGMAIGSLFLNRRVSPR